MKIQYHLTANDFLSHAGGALARDEGRYGLILGIARRLVANPHWYGQDDPWFCSVQDKGRVCAVATRTPPYKVLLAYFSGDLFSVASSLSEAVAGKWAVIPGVTGDKELADSFQKLWCRKRGVTVQKTMAERIYRLEKVNPVPLAKGRLRPATEADKELVVEWAHAFYLDTFGTDRNMPESDITPALAGGAVFIWEDERPVSMALKTRPTDKGIAVGGVYTPPELRRKGYATSCVAELSRHILQSGYRFCTLFADLANLTSNSIYKKIGYKEVCDSVDYMFEMP